MSKPERGYMISPLNTAARAWSDALEDVREKKRDYECAARDLEKAQQRERELWAVLDDARHGKANSNV